MDSINKNTKDNPVDTEAIRFNGLYLVENGIITIIAQIIQRRYEKNFLLSIFPKINSNKTAPEMTKKMNVTPPQINPSIPVAIPARAPKINPLFNFSKVNASRKK